MKKRIALILIIIVLMILFCGCSNKKAENEDTEYDVYLQPDQITNAVFGVCNSQDKYDINNDGQDDGIIEWVCLEDSHSKRIHVSNIQVPLTIEVWTTESAGLLSIKKEYLLYRSERSMTSSPQNFTIPYREMDFSRTGLDKPSGEGRYESAIVEVTVTTPDGFHYSSFWALILHAQPKKSIIGIQNAPQGDPIIGSWTLDLTKSDGIKKIAKYSFYGNGSVSLTLNDVSEGSREWERINETTYYAFNSTTQSEPFIFIYNPSTDTLVLRGFETVPFHRAVR